ncbi:MAG: hypothetical protein L3J24_05320 [Xanthomonadales bacterium]|nr:hypothetical protein [Xanthomonadales bacterium]
MQRLLRLNKVGPLIAGLSNQKIIGKNLKNIYANPTRLSALEIGATWTMMTYNNWLFP